MGHGAWSKGRRDEGEERSAAKYQSRTNPVSIANGILKLQVATCLPVDRVTGYKLNKKVRQ